MAVELQYCLTVPPGDPQQRPVRFIGKLRCLKDLKWPQISDYLSPRVDQPTWSAALESVEKNTTVSLWLSNAIVSALPFKVSRHNSPGRPHALTRTVNSLKLHDHPEYAFIIACERSEAYSLGCAVARCYPRYNKSTTSSTGSIKNINVQVGFIFVGDDTRPLTDQERQALSETCEGIRLTQYIVDAPCSEMHTDGFLEQIKEVGAKLGLTPFVIRGENLKEKGFGGIYGVGQGASRPPALAVLSHCPPGATKTIAWVGKGIVFDTGGTCLKTRLSMLGMKRDCGGAAAILGGFYAAVKLGFSENLHAVLCLAENSIGPLATRPDDVHTLYSGKTVEINNTDAEGRLVLGDGVVYASKDLKADIVVDMATLTGAQGVATGKYHGAILSNDEGIEGHCSVAGRASGDLVFPVPFAPELHFGEFNSVLADMKNSVQDRSNAAVSCAGLFIFSHLGFDFSGTWLHIDMASPVCSGERATGYGVALLATLFGSLSSNPLLKSIAPTISMASKGDEHTVTKKRKIET